MRAFSTFHPASLFTYLTGAILFSILTMNPVFTVASLLGGILFYCLSGKQREVAGNLMFYFCLFLLIAVFFPLFSHNGVTPLFFLNDRPVTYEAIRYGAAISGTIIALFIWCNCYTLVMTSDKFVYLFGKISPKLSLHFSMFLRFLPSMRAQYRHIKGTQKTLGLYSSKSVTDKIVGQIRILSILLTWSFENTVEVTASMKARGYGLKGRRSYSIFRFHVQDLVLFFVSLGLIITGIIFMLSGKLNFWYYPAISSLPQDTYSILLYTLTAAFMLIPFIIEIKENITWKYLKSKI